MINSGIISLMGAYDPDAVAYFNQLSTQPSADFKVAVNTLVKTLKADGNWTALDRLWIHATEIQQHATISLVNPTSTAITEVNSPTWTANQGYTGNGSNMYLNTNFTPSTQSTKSSQNNAHFSVYNVLSRTANTGAFGGNNATSVTAIFPRFTGNVFFGYVNDNHGAVGYASASSQGLYSVRRISSTEIEYFKNGTSLGTESSNSVSLPSVNLFLLARNNNGSTVNYSNDRVAISLYGAGDINNASLYTAIQTFATTRGFNV